MRLLHVLTLSATVLALAACSSADPTARTTDIPNPLLATQVHTPLDYDDTQQYPLIVLLHGFGSSPAVVESYFGLESLADTYDFLYVAPGGTPDTNGTLYWNATDACCDFDGAGTDHSTALLQLVQHVQDTYSVDPARIYFVGHSNGGFMSYRMACDHADVVAAVVSLAGATWSDPTRCAPSAPVSVLQIHGTADTTITYADGVFGGRAHPGALATAAAWASYDGCDVATTTTPAALDLDSLIPDAETSRTAFAGCPVGVAVELWSIEGGSHGPAASPAFTPSLIEFLLAHPKP